ncbi:MAG: YbjQ family protein [Desulfobulbaceae bacterium]|nr:YbjQ family protein [Desulfobulbaceae bacterium]
MKKRTAALVIFLLFSTTTIALARDEQVQFSIEDALNSLKVQSELNPAVQLFWGDQKHPEAQTTFGEYRTSQRTNALGKAREEACQWALAACIKELQARALREGGNAVINIKSNIKNIETSSATEYQCLAGSVMVNVALKGTVVKLAE